MSNKVLRQLLIMLIALMLFIGGCGEDLSNYQSEIVKKAELIISSNNVDELSAREVRILLGLLYLECVKLKEQNNEGSSHDKLFTTFSNLIPTYKNLEAQEEERFKTMQIDSLLKTSEVVVEALRDDSDEALIRRKDELETHIRDLETQMSEMIADEQEFFNALLPHNNCDSGTTYMGESQSKGLPA